MKFDQIAYYAHNEQQVVKIKKLLGLDDKEWVEDEVVGEVMIGKSTIKHRSRAHLRFCYAHGIETEILTYLEGPHWHESKWAFNNGEIFISHFGFHMEPGEDPLRVGEVLQRMTTLTHTNPYLIEQKRTYDYLITASPFGPDFKYIWRKNNA